MRAGRILLIVLLGASLLAPLADAASHSVTTPGLFWDPASLTIDVGDSVTFSNPTTTPHTWVRDDATDSCNLPCTRTFSIAQTLAYHCGIHPSMKGTIQVGPGILLTVTTPTPGALVSGLVRVEGSAQYAAGDVTDVSVRFDGAPAVAATLAGSGGSVTWIADVPSAMLVDGARDLVAHASATGGTLSEVRVPVVVDNPDLIDLNVIQLFVQSSAIGTTSVLTYTVRNDGNVESGPFVVRAEYLYHGTWRPIGERTQTSVGAHLAGQGGISWTPSPRILIGSFTVRVLADPAGVTQDVDLSDNTRQGKAGWFTSAIAGVDLTEPV